MAEVIAAIFLVLLWLIGVVCSLLVTAAVVAIAGDVLGLWEAVSFV